MCDIKLNQELRRELYQTSSLDRSENRSDTMGNGEEMLVWTDENNVTQCLTMNQLNKENNNRPAQCPDILMNIAQVPGADEEKQHLKEKSIPLDDKEVNHGPWKSKELGELVPDMKETAKLKRKRQQRKLKKGLGWAFWITCAPLAVCFNLIREQPEDPDDPYDWNDDPLRPWRYKVTLPQT